MGIQEFEIGFEVILMIGTIDWVRCNGKYRGRKLQFGLQR